MLSFLSSISSTAISTFSTFSIPTLSSPTISSLFSSTLLLYSFLSFLFVTFILSVLSTWKWAVWLSLSFLLGLIKSFIGCYQGIRILIDLVLLVFLKFYIKLYKLSASIFFETSTEMKLRRKMRNSSTYREWLSYAQKINQDVDNLKWRDSDENLPTLIKLQQTINKLQLYRERNDYQSLLYELPGIVKRNHLGIDDNILHLRCLTNTKNAIENYHQELTECLQYIANLPNSIFNLSQKIEFFQKLSKNVGNTALCLSGGGSLSMYHMGVLRALCESGNYKNIRVISGASGGSISTAMCAVKTEAELLDQVTVDDVSTDFKRTGEMKRDKIVWFPPLWKQALNFLHTGFLVENSEFQRTCSFYWGDITFQEAYQITHRHVCISVTSAASGGAGPRKLLLNHVSTPHVLIRSAVAASCALPGIMAPNALLCKNADGTIVPFEVDGVDFIDGSVQADVPFKRMATLFSVSNFIVSQVNVHVIPFIEYKLHDALPSGATLVRSMLNAIDLDIRHRSLILATMGVLPKLYGQDISALFKQRYHGDVTIVPDMKIEESLGIKAIMHPTKADMESYIRGGRKATWPHLQRIQHLLHIESCIWNILESLLQKEHDIPLHETESYLDSNSSPRPPLFRRDMMSVSNFLVYQAPSSSSGPLSNSRDKRNSQKSSLAEIILRKNSSRSYSNTPSPMPVSAMIEEEGVNGDQPEGEEEEKEGSLSEKEQITRRMTQLEIEYSNLQRRLASLESSLLSS